MKNIIFGLVAAVLLGAIIFVSYSAGIKRTDKNTQVSVSPSAAKRNPVSPSGTVVGNDRDEHGCIGSAGYSWCAAKNKCIRVWEEPCQNPDDKDLITAALYKKNNWPEDLATVTVSTNDGQYASGTVGSQGGGGYFYAAKVNGTWEIVADGNGIIPCSALEKYPDFPKTLIQGCYNEQTGQVVKR